MPVTFSVVFTAVCTLCAVFFLGALCAKWSRPSGRAADIWQMAEGVPHIVRCCWSVYIIIQDEKILDGPFAVSYVFADEPARRGDVIWREGDALKIRRLSYLEDDEAEHSANMSIHD